MTTTFAAATSRTTHQLRSIESYTKLGDIAPAWRELQQHSLDATVFSTYEWNSVTARHFAKDTPLRVLLYEQDGARALLPLVYRKAHTLRALTFLGAGLLNYSPADYQDWLCAAGSEDIAIQTFGEELAASEDWDLLWLQELPQASRLLRRLPGLARRHGWRLVQFGDDDAFHIDLPATWEDYEATLSTNTRTNLGRKTRKLQREADARFETADEAGLDAAMRSLFDLHQRRWRASGKPGIFAGARMKAFHEDLARSLEHAGMLDLTLLRAAEETIGARYNFRFRGVHSFYASGFDPEERWAPYSLGMLMDGQGIRSAIDNGMTREDLLRGDGAYKQRYAPSATINQDVRIFRTGSAYRKYTAYKALRNLVRKLAGRKDLIRWRVEAGRTAEGES